MEEEQSSQETVNTPSEEPTSDVESKSGGSNKWIIAGFVVVVLLVIIGLFLPPFSLGDRLGLTGSREEPVAEVDDPTAEPATAEEPADSSAANLEVPGEFSVNSDDAVVSVASVPAAGLAAAGIGELPQDVVSVGNVYTVAYDGSAPAGFVAVTQPAGADLRTTDLYGWDGTAWHFVASEVDSENQQFVSTPQTLHQAYGLVQAGVPDAYTLGAELSIGHELAPEILDVIDQLSVGTLFLVGNGDLQGEPVAVPDGDFETYLRLSNAGAIVDISSLAAFLSDSAAQDTQINNVVNTAVNDGFTGINLDYQGVDASQREAFTRFVGSLADALHAQELKLIVTLGTPRDTGGAWETGGQDWAAIGALADEIQVQMPLDPTTYGQGESAQQLLDWTVRHIDRSKLMMLSSANAVSQIGESNVELSNESALANFGSFSQAEGETEIEPGTAVDVVFTGEATPLEWDGASQTYRFSYVGDAEQTHFVWLGNPAALAQRLEVGEPYNVRGASVRGLGTLVNPAGYPEAIEALGPGAAPATEGAAIVWTVRDENDSVLASESGTSLAYTWEGSETPGAYSVNADFALGQAVIPLGTLPVSVAEAVEEEVAAAESDEAETEEEADAGEETAAAETAPLPSFDPGDADGVVSVDANVRVGPGLGYGFVTGGANAGTQVNVIGRSDDATWLQIVMPDDREGWIFSQLLTLNDNLDVASLEVVEVAAPVASAPAAGGGDDGGGTTAAPPPPVSAPPVANAGFELGGQTHTFANPQLMSYSGMNWVKFQHKWGEGGDPNGLADRINQAHANGFKVLLSIPGANTYPSSISFAEYTQFLGGVAALGPDAIEVWNEMNIDFEWPAGQIDPNSYVTDMLAPAYNSIKAANPNVMVISGAPAPTGFDNNTNAWSDSRYMAGMAAAGAANYLDCVGAHYNAGATPPSQNTGHPAGNDHYSWYLIPTLNVYAQLGKPVCFTELGYLSGADYGGVPERFGWASGNSVSDHANWLAQAVSLSANTGSVRMVIVFNVDFTQWGDDPQAGYAMIRKDGSCPACESLRSVMGG